MIRHATEAPHGGATRVVLAIAALLTALGGSGCQLLMSSLPEPTTLEQRLAMVDAEGLDLRAPVAIRWDAHQIPFVLCEHDEDLPFALGWVHAHLRLGQMEVLRRISAGRAAEMLGPPAVPIDRLVRTFGLGRAVPAIEASIASGRTHRWLRRFVAGVNAYTERLAARDALPHEFDALDLEVEPWTVQDVLRLGRLAGVDVNWLEWLRIGDARRKPGWPRRWRDRTSLTDDDTPRALARRTLGALARGSNCVVVDGARSASGGALIASDPHLGILLPPLWLIVGYRSPSHHAVGLMAPGLPALGLGRNRTLAWGGTNLRAAVSDLVDVSDAPAEAFSEHTESIAVRAWFDTSVTVRMVRLDGWVGPVVSDLELLDGVFREGETVALRWVGHRATDELGALLDASQARDVATFAGCFDGFATPAQHFHAADAAGNVVHVLATQLPQRNGVPADLVVSREAARAAWSRLLRSRELPRRTQAPRGWLASANDPPPPARGQLRAGQRVPVGWLYRETDRIRRIGELLGDRDDGAISLDDLARLQLDTVVPTQRRLAALVLRSARKPLSRASPDANPEASPVLDAVAAWDGRFDADSRGALAWQLWLARLVPALADASNTPPRDDAPHLLLADLRRADADLRRRVALTSARAASEDLARLDRRQPDGARATWGAIHRLRLRHPLGALPLLGARYVAADLPVDGTSASLLKSAHPLTSTRHATSYGACARHLSDLADPDRNRFVLLGGQDGWIGSSTYVDQLTPWRAGRAIAVPLTPDAVRRSFEHETLLQPAR